MPVLYFDGLLEGLLLGWVLGTFTAVIAIPWVVDSWHAAERRWTSRVRGRSRER